MPPGTIWACYSVGWNTAAVRRSPLVARLLRQGASAEQIVTEFYLAALSRYPSVRELRAITPRLGHSKQRRQALEDLIWSVLNTKEFLVRR